LQAFLAFSRGLEQEDARDYVAAAASFRKAVELDPKFEMAAESASNVTAFADGSFDLSNVIGQDLRPDQGVMTYQDIVNARLASQI
jgi:hypothetical protein